MKTEHRFKSYDEANQFGRDHAARGVRVVRRYDAVPDEWVITVYSFGEGQWAKCKKADIVEGREYRITHGGSSMTRVVVDKIQTTPYTKPVRTRYECVKIATGRRILVKSASKFYEYRLNGKRVEVDAEGRPKQQ